MEEFKSGEETIEYKSDTPLETTQSSKEQQSNKTKKNAAKKGAIIASLFTVGILCASFLLWMGLYLQQQPVQQINSAGSGIPPLFVKDPPEDTGGLPTTEIVTKVASSVVSIELYMQGKSKLAGSGSGIVISEDGYIVTNSHVVEGAAAIRVILADGEGHRAKLIGRSAKHDLAVIKIDAENLSPAEFGDSEQVQVGQRAIAIGNAAGLLPGSPTQGIISGINREIPMETADGYIKMKLLQTDAAINPGNSGGALVNMHGQVIGINIAKLQSIDIDNIGFAIPSNEALPVIMDLIAHGEIPAPPILGVSVWALNETIGPELGLPSEGLFIEKLEAKSDLARLDVAQGDVILTVEGKAMLDTSDLTKSLEKCKPGDTIKMEIYKAKTGEKIEIEPVLYARAA